MDAGPSSPDRQSAFAGPGLPLFAQVKETPTISLPWFLSSGLALARQRMGRPGRGPHKSGALLSIWEQLGRESRQGKWPAIQGREWPAEPWTKAARKGSVSASPTWRPTRTKAWAPLFASIHMCFLLQAANTTQRNSDSVHCGWNCWQSGSNRKTGGQLLRMRRVPGHHSRGETPGRGVG